MSVIFTLQLFALAVFVRAVARNVAHRWQEPYQDPVVYSPPDSPISVGSDIPHHTPNWMLNVTYSMHNLRARLVTIGVDRPEELPHVLVHGLPADRVGPVAGAELIHALPRLGHHHGGVIQAGPCAGRATVGARSPGRPPRGSTHRTARSNQIRRGPPP
eukprot:752302-Hanusia_phi.AAC.2